MSPTTVVTSPIAPDAVREPVHALDEIARELGELGHRRHRVGRAR